MGAQLLCSGVCRLVRNRLSAQLHRERQRAYINGLQHQVAALSAERDAWRSAFDTVAAKLAAATATNARLALSGLSLPLSAETVAPAPAPPSGQATRNADGSDVMDELLAAAHSQIQPRTGAAAEALRCSVIERVEACMAGRPAVQPPALHAPRVSAAASMRRTRASKRDWEATDTDRTAAEDAETDETSGGSPGAASADSDSCSGQYRPMPKRFAATYSGLGETRAADSKRRLPAVSIGVAPTLAAAEPLFPALPELDDPDLPGVVDSCAPPAPAATAAFPFETQSEFTAEAMHGRGFEELLGPLEADESNSAFGLVPGTAAAAGLGTYSAVEACHPPAFERNVSLASRASEAVPASNNVSSVGLDAAYTAPVAAPTGPWGDAAARPAGHDSPQLMPRQLSADSLFAF